MIAWLKSLKARITRNWRAPIGPNALSFGYIADDGTFYPGYMTRGGEMRYEKKGVPPTYESAQYVKSVPGVMTHTESNALGGDFKRTQWDAWLDIYRKRNRVTGKCRYWVGSLTNVTCWIDSNVWVTHDSVIKCNKPNEA